VESASSDEACDCIDCGAGEYVDVTGSDGASDCIECVVGKYIDVPGSDEMSDCIDCAAGKYSAVTGSGTPSDCTDCSAGKYMRVAVVDSSESSDCIDCPASTFANDGATACISCPDGTHSETPGGTSEAACVPQCLDDQYVNHSCVPRTIACQGEWSACNDRCVSFFLVATPAVSGGLQCRSDEHGWSGAVVYDLAAANCVAGERDGLCTANFHSSSKPESEPQIQIREVVREVVMWKTKMEYVYVNMGCDGVPNSGKAVDDCGVCGGPGPNACGECGGICLNGVATKPVRLEVPMATICPNITALAEKFDVLESQISLQCTQGNATGGLRRAQEAEFSVVIDISVAVDQPPLDVRLLDTIDGLHAEAATLEEHMVYDCFGQLAVNGTAYPAYDLCNVCDGANDCIVCVSGFEKCTVADGCAGGCRECPSGWRSDPGEACEQCRDGQQPNTKRSTCVGCPAGTAGTGGTCSACGAGKEANFNSTACVQCPAGKRRDDTAGMLVCDACPAGAQPTESQRFCTLCTLGHRSDPAETGGLCSPCERGTQPTGDSFGWMGLGATRCSECSVGTFSRYLQVPGANGVTTYSAAQDCQRCPEIAMTTALPGAASVESCQCVEGKYDAARLGVVYGHPSNFGDGSHARLMADSADDIEGERRCIACPTSYRDFAACAANSTAQRIGGALTVQAGYAELNIAAANGSRHFFRCPFGDKACPEAPLGPMVPGAAPNCSEGYTGVLCAACTATHAQTKRGCVDCGGGDGSANTVMFVAGGLLLLGALAALMSWLVRCESRHIAGLVLWLAVAQRIWPRVKQSLAIFASNYQIVSQLPFVIDVDMPSPFKEVLQSIGGVVDGTIDAIPSVACTVGGSFRNRLILKALIPLVLLGLCRAVHMVRVWHLVRRRMPIATGVKKPWRVKIARALIRNQLIYTKSSWDFAIIYLLYPTVSNAASQPSLRFVWILIWSVTVAGQRHHPGHVLLPQGLGGWDEAADGRLHRDVHR
jgi:hypothetical protein